MGIEHFPLSYFELGEEQTQQDEDDNTTAITDHSSETLKHTNVSETGKLSANAASLDTFLEDMVTRAGLQGLTYILEENMIVCLVRNELKGLKLSNEEIQRRARQFHHLKLAGSAQSSSSQVSSLSPNSRRNRQAALAPALARAPTAASAADGGGASEERPAGSARSSSSQVGSLLPNSRENGQAALAPALARAPTAASAADGGGASRERPFVEFEASLVNAPVRADQDTLGSFADAWSLGTFSTEGSAATDGPGHHATFPIRVADGSQNPKKKSKH